MTDAVDTAAASGAGPMHPELLPQERPLAQSWLADAVRRTLSEDLGGFPGRDVTTQATIPSDARVSAAVVMRESGVVAGLDVVPEVLGQVAIRLGLPRPTVELAVSDGDQVDAGTTLATIEGVGHVVLIAERTMLNLLSRASGIATHTRRWATALQGTGAQVLDTRKTTPMLRELEKYAVRCGGGVNKRIGLYDCAMVKDNHIAAAGSVTAAIQAIAEAFPDVPVQVEVESPAQAHEAIKAGARFLMLDNMAPDAMAELVAEIRAKEKKTGRVLLEATGGLTLDNAADVAVTGVDYLSVGALTHSSPIVDIALDLK
ncbi:carboxylating nicotinate-nucleotide diphosphorylase [Demequina sp. SYSU T00b26]|uniref:nicotinate-nucleotide diphosphorylase (carboxylating) n=2 Tax=Demequina zhanjiangensis TaxID=3051659 RepID=A0ABT8FYZ0_9MICO|nr:carboxylating nicotinate-nucleotide diphosphorylase [Demequina sp. SYSU T00b26]MDN4471982.1 carboxylating nicotinate-nucleotide diphosphorylase [Demequina sp. SYSU T00b26]